MTDPICGMTVEPERAAGNYSYDGQTYYFCSGHCLAKFKEEPARYVTTAALENSAASDRVTDPVCGMKVDPSKAGGSHEYNGQTYYFCGRHCLTKFKEDPKSILRPAGVGQVAHGHEHAAANPAHHHSPSPTPEKTQPAAGGFYVCPMDLEVRESKPGACPKCGMALEAEVSAAPALKTEYVCPMHPEIVRSEPGSCPICGMALEPRTVTLEEAANPELTDMTRRFWVSAALSLPLFAIAM